MKKVMQSKVRFTDGGDVFFESKDAKKLYDQMFLAFRAAVKRNEKWDGTFDTFFTTPSPYDGAKKEGYDWGLKRAETPEFLVEITEAIDSDSFSSIHVASFYKK
jgi:hypothetical protein